MTDSEYIAKEFRREIRERKTLGYSAKKKINGSKSKRSAKLSSDYLTDKQLRERNGQVMTYNLNQPMGWKEFKMIPEDLQKEYIKTLVNKYELTQHALCEMFGITRVPLAALLDKLDLRDIFPRGRKMSARKIIAFEEFLHPTLKEPEPASEEVVEQVDDAVTKTDAEVFTDAKMVMSNAQFTFCGSVDFSQVSNTLRQCIPSNARVRLTVSYEILE